MTVYSLALALALAVAVLIVVGVPIYDALTGRRLLADLRDKRRLRSRSLAEWDAHCTANSNRSDIVVCLTTTPSRIDRLPDTLSSLLAQSRRPAVIRLHLPEKSRREGRPYVVPEALRGLANVELVPCEDDGPATKLIPALRDYPPEQPIVFVDDDMLYPPDLVEVFDRRGRETPDRALALSGWIVPPDLIDRATTPLSNLFQTPPAPMKCTRIRQDRQIDVFQGYGGVLVRPRFFDLAQVEDYSGAPEEARFVDDVWLSGHCNVDKYVIAHGRYPFIPWRHHQHYIRTSLGRINRGQGDPETRPNTIAVQHLKDRWMTSRQAG